MAIRDNEMLDSELVAYRQRIEKWRQDREAALRSPDGWLSLVGLHMLEEGEYTLGSDPANAIELPASLPEQWATLVVHANYATLRVNDEPLPLVDGLERSVVEMVDNQGGRQPTLVKVGGVSLNLHRFGDEVALRVRDRTSAAIQQFDGCAWYAIDPAYCVVGKLIRQTSRVIHVATSVSTVAEYQSAGEICFELQDQSLSLLGAVTSKADELMIIFRDATAGRETYGAGRYLYATLHEDDGAVTLDFNKAYSPPCAFTPFATCSLPPAENVLAVPIAAGELYRAE